MEIFKHFCFVRKWTILIIMKVNINCFFFQHSPIMNTFLCNKLFMHTFSEYIGETLISRATMYLWLLPSILIAFKWVMINISCFYFIDFEFQKKKIAWQLKLRNCFASTKVKFRGWNRLLFQNYEKNVFLLTAASSFNCYVKY